MFCRAGQLNPERQNENEYDETRRFETGVVGTDRLHGGKKHCAHRAMVLPLTKKHNCLNLIKMKNISSVILSLALTAGAVCAQMQSANLKPDAWYSIVAVHSGKALEIAGGVDGKANGLQLQQNEVTGADNQLFQFKQARSGFFTITAKHSGKVLEIRDNSMKDHASVQQNEANGQDNQLFTLVKDPGSYRIIARSTGYGFDVSGGVKSTSNNIPVIVYPATGAVNQTFRIVEAGAKPSVPGNVGDHSPGTKPDHTSK